MKKILVLLLAVVLSMFLYSCGDEEDISTGNGGDGSKIGIGFDVDKALSEHSDATAFEKFLENKGFATYLFDFTAGGISTPVEGAEKYLMAFNYDDEHIIMLGFLQMGTEKQAKDYFDNPDIDYEDAIPEGTEDFYNKCKEFQEKYFPKNTLSSLEYEKFLSKKVVLKYEITDRYASSQDKLSAYSLCKGSASLDDLTGKLDILGFESVDMDKETIESIYGTNSDLSVNKVTNGTLYMNGSVEENSFTAVQLLKCETEEEAVKLYKMLALMVSYSGAQTYDQNAYFDAFDLYKAHGSFDKDAHIFNLEEIVCYGSTCVDEYYVLDKCACGEIVEDIEENRRYVTPKGYHVAAGEGEVTKESTCTTEGALTFLCVDCGRNFDESLPTVADAHVYGSTVDAEIEVTCEEDGYGKFYCRECKTTIEGVIPKGHVYEYVYPTPRPNYSVDSLDRSCLRCGESYYTISVRPITPGMMEIPIFMYNCFYIEGICFYYLNIDGAYYVKFLDSIGSVSVSIVDNTVVVCMYGLNEFSQTFTVE